MKHPTRQEFEQAQAECIRHGATLHQATRTGSNTQWLLIADGQYHEFDHWRDALCAVKGLDLFGALP